MVTSRWPPTTLRVLGGKPTTSGVSIATDTTTALLFDEKVLDFFRAFFEAWGKKGCRVADMAPAGVGLFSDRPNSAPLARTTKRSTDSGGLRAQLPNGMRLGWAAS